ncbi:glutamine--fructose-6-phosphate transaminase (isomerizing) [Candidatus Daviesbacteria bacterium]|nr:glutamine--fructose-6-phosphate transaminase (isomerizing) [Candidatus Daviesbacteria bacterium]
MCGIFGYVGTNDDAAEKVLQGLKRLEYRGYDSWGIAVLNGKIKLSKKVGAIGDINGQTSLPRSSIGIGHTRWATHGGINEINAHPHLSSDRSFALAQNGIVENYLELKKELLKKNFKFNSETDTEVIVRLVEQELKHSKNLIDAIRLAFLKLKGRNTVIILTQDGRMIAARNGSPLVVGLNKKDREIYLSSDTLSFAPFVQKMIVVENSQLVYCQDGNIKLMDIKSGRNRSYIQENVDLDNNTIDKEGYPHFMVKEIHEGPYVIRQLLNQDIKIYQQLVNAIKKAKNVYTIASGTTGIAASQIAFYLRIYTKIKVTSLIGAEALDYYDLFSKGDLIIAPSQSGETADVLEVLEVAKKKGVKIASFVNMSGSTMTRMSDIKFMTQSGPEVCVMSTKVFVSQIAWGYLIAKIAQGKLKEGVRNLNDLAYQMDKYLKDRKNHKAIKLIGKKLIKAKNIFLLGKYQNLNIIKEGMVKIIEGTYKHAHAIPAGDLKHYAITLIEKGVPVISAVSCDVAERDILNAVNEVKARGATIIGISPKPHQSFDFHLQVPDTKETSAIMNIIPLQLLSYYMTVELGHNVDKPRNIAKSVTVK